jgi:hypothetical protein
LFRVNAIRLLSLLCLLAGAWALGPARGGVSAPADPRADVSLAPDERPAVAPVDAWADDATGLLPTRRPAPRSAVDDGAALGAGFATVIRAVATEVGDSDRPGQRALSGRRASRAPPTA